MLLEQGERDAEALARLLAATADAWDRQGHRLEELIEALTPERLELPTRRRCCRPAATRGKDRPAAGVRCARQRPGRRAGRLARANRAALANRWRAEQRVLAVPMGDELLYPGFQFTAEGKPHPAVGAALAELRADPRLSDWQAALWFAGSNGWLGGRRPIDLLDDEPDAVVKRRAPKPPSVFLAATFRTRQPPPSSTR